MHIKFEVPADYIDYYAAQLKHLELLFKTMAGGQYITRGSDIRIPASEMQRAHEIVKNLDNFTTQLPDITNAFKSQLGLS